MQGVEEQVLGEMTLRDRAHRPRPELREVAAGRRRGLAGGRQPGRQTPRAVPAVYVAASWASVRLSSRSWRQSSQRLMCSSR